MLVIRKTRYLSVLGFVLFSTFIFTSILVAEVPDLINYQGVLTDDAGIPVPDGNYAMDFTLYTTEVGDTGVWSQTFPAVSVVDGIINVKLGPFIYPGQVFDGDLFLEIEVNGEIFAPRQRLSATAYAMRAVVADGVTDGSVTAIMLANDAVNTDKLVDGAVTAAKVAGGFIPDLDADKLDGHDTTYFATATTVIALQNQVTALQSQVDTLVTLLANVTRSGYDITFSGVNVRIVNGTGTTNGTTNGLGNLIVGYNEIRSSGNVRTGSHNIVVGMQNNFSSYGGLVAGYQNSISGTLATVSGGSLNEAFSDYSAILGGRGNLAGDNSNPNDHSKGVQSTVSGGYRNSASGDYSSVSGGGYNVASGRNSIVAGGGGENDYEGNIAFANYSSILGGRANGTGDVVRYYDNVDQFFWIGPGTYHGNGIQSTVSSGYANIASGSFSSVSGGTSNVAYGNASSVSGGVENTARKFYDSVSGGANNTASGGMSSVSGGRLNEASGDYSSVSGGGYNVASGRNSIVAGGGGEDDYEGNIAFANYSSILGGRANGTGDVVRYYDTNNEFYWLSPGSDHIVGTRSTVSSGYANIANGWDSSVSGGIINEANGTYSSVSGGAANKADGFASSVSGGSENTASNSYSSVSGGYRNPASGKHSSVLGGNNNPASGEYHSNVGDATRVYINGDLLH